jgi:hypothetical protein
MYSKMFFPFLSFIWLLLRVHANSQTPSLDSLLKISNGTYLAFQAKDEKKMQALTTSDFIYVGSEGVLSGKELGKATRGCTLRNFELVSPKVKTLSPTSATITYTAHQDESCAGKPLPSVLFNVDVFVRRGGKWLVSTHAEAAATDAGK